MFFMSAVAMARYNSLRSSKGSPRIPYTIVRGMSNWVHAPLEYEGNGLWSAGPAVEDFTNGYQ